MYKYLILCNVENTIVFVFFYLYHGCILGKDGWEERGILSLSSSYIWIHGDFTEPMSPPGCPLDESLHATSSCGSMAEITGKSL